MANFCSVTASNGAKLKPGSAAIIWEWFLNDHFQLCCDVDLDTANDWLHISGEDWLDIADDNDEEALPQFLEELAPHLEEPFMIQCVGNEKCRFPLSAMEVTVYPDGEIVWNQFQADVVYKIKPGKGETNGCSINEGAVGQG